MSLTAREMIEFLGRLSPETPIESVLDFSCGHCGGKRADTVKMHGRQRFASMPQPKREGREHIAVREQIEGIAPNSDVRSWCWHDEQTVTLEVLQVLTVPINLVTQLGSLSEEERGSKIIEQLGTVIFQTMASVGFHCAEVAICQEHGGECGHKKVVA